MEQKDRLVDRFNLVEMYRTAKVPLICIYDSPEDWPGKFVARLWDLHRPTSMIAVADTLEEIRGTVPEGMVPVQRSREDALCIVETWI